MADGDQRHQQIHFHDEVPGASLDFGVSNPTGVDTSGITGVDLGDFLERPVRIDAFTWSEGGFASHSFDPWSLFLSDPVIKKKIDNYGLLRMRLHLKFMISASPFYYSNVLISYNPVPFNHMNPQVVIASDEQMVTYSQRPHLWLQVQENEGGEMILPFFYWFDWLPNKSSDIAQMGEIRFDSPVVLRNANSVLGGEVTITTYAWATEVELAAPTLELQSKRSSRAARKKMKQKPVRFMDKVSKATEDHAEYANGPVSNIASAVAAASAQLTNIPVIGPFARATEIGSGAISRVASWFGYTNLPELSNVAPFKDLPFGAFACSDTAVPTPRLTLDSKNELSIDPRLVGLDPTDELGVEVYAGKESYLTNFDWKFDQLPDAVLWTSAVSPAQMYRLDGTNCYLTPMAHMMQCYQYWKGDIIFRFQIVCTKFHKGRFKIQYEPSLSASPTDTYDDTSNITRVYDIAETTDVEVCVPYMQAAAWLQIPQLSSTAVPFDTNPALITGVSGHNGYLKVSVVNQQNAPVLSADINIIVSVRAGPSFKVAGPINPPNTVQYVAQGEAIELEDMGDCDDETPNLHLTYMGETAHSIRQLLHRHCKVRSFSTGGLVNGYTSTFYMYPLPLNSTASTRNIHDVGGGARRTYNSNTFVSWFSPAFGGRRGSMYWAVNQTDTDLENRMMLKRAPDVALLPTTYDVNETFDDSSSANYAYSTLTSGPNARSGNGVALYNAATQTGVTALIPYINARKFVDTFPSPFATSTVTRSGLYPNVVQFSSMSRSSIKSGDFFCASGPDFNLHFFIGVPTVGLNIVPPPP